MTTLVVMIGAGASFDCVSPSISDYNQDFKPPLVNDLFEMRGSFAAILRKYPEAEALSPKIRTLLASGPGRERSSLEELLLSFSQSVISEDRRMFLQVPLYLQELLGEVSHHFVRSGGTQFDWMVQEINTHIGSKYEHVVYLTVNYDLFLDVALEKLYRLSFSTLGFYLSKTWSLVKLHGSVNWGIRAFTADSDDLPNNLHALAKLAPDHQIITKNTEDIVVLNGHQKRVRDGYFHYPALAIPVQGKSGFVCSRALIDAALKAMNAPSDVIVAGCRMVDADVLQLFMQISNPRRLKVVSRDESDAHEIALRIMNQCKNFSKSSVSLSTQGFAKFVGNRELLNFLSE